MKSLHFADVMKTKQIDVTRPRAVDCRELVAFNNSGRIKKDKGRHHLLRFISGNGHLPFCILSRKIDTRKHTVFSKWTPKRVNKNKRNMAETWTHMDQFGPLQGVLECPHYRFPWFIARMLF